jgi:amidase
VDAVRRTGELLQGLGHEVVEIEDWPGAAMFPDTRVMPLHAMYGARFAAMAAHGLIPPVEQLEPANQALVELGRQFSASDYILANHLAQESSRRLVAMFDDYDALLTPTRAVRPPLVDELREHAAKAMNNLGRAGHFTAQFNVSGQPAVTVPIGFDELGLPIGAQLAGRPADEATLIRLSAQLETAQPWRHVRPAIGQLAQSSASPAAGDPAR